MKSLWGAFFISTAHHWPAGSLEAYSLEARETQGGSRANELAQSGPLGPAGKAGPLVEGLLGKMEMLEASGVQ